MSLIVAPNHYHSRPRSKSVFLAGGITGCPNWQAEAILCIRERLPEWDILNPRRDDFDINDPSIARQQIEWEFDMLDRATAIMFWFPKESLCPIALYELGFYLSRFQKVENLWEVPIVIGCDPGYSRLFDVQVQYELATASMTRRGFDKPTIFSTIEDTVGELHRVFNKVDD